MVRSWTALPLLTVCSCAGWSQDEPESPLLSGYITAAAAGGSIDVNGLHLQLTRGAEIRVHDGAKWYVHKVVPEQVFLGEQVDVYGKLQRKAAAIAVTRAA